MKAQKGERMKILEQYQKGKISDKLCEDRLVVTDKFIAVIDGVTSKSGFSYQGKSTGFLAAQMVVQAVREAKKKDTYKDILQCCQKKISEFYEYSGFTEDWKKNGPQAVAVIYSDYYRKIWMIGDCQAMIDGKRFVNPKKSDLVLADFRSMILWKLHQEKKLDFLSGDEGREVILPWILAATVFSNDDSTPYGYAVINGESIPEGLIKTISLDDQAHEIVLASDGYPVFEDSLETSEQELEKCLNNDPFCYKDCPGTKGLGKNCCSFDDRTYIRFEIDERLKDEKEADNESYLSSET